MIEYIIIGILLIIIVIMYFIHKRRKKCDEWIITTLNDENQEMYKEIRKGEQ